MDPYWLKCSGLVDSATRAAGPYWVNHIQLRPRSTQGYPASVTATDVVGGGYEDLTANDLGAGGQ
jgi:hypothetical protein